MFHTRSRWSVLAVPAAAVLLVGAAATAPATGAAATSRTAGTAAGPSAVTSTSHVSQVRLRASTSSLPHSAVHHGGGAVNLTESGALQRYANRSDSPRPKVVRNASGQRVMARAAAPSWLPHVTGSPVSSTRPGAVRGQEGLNEYDNEKYAGFSTEPPDQGLCAGGGHSLEMINSTVRVYSSSGTPQGTAYLNDFFKEPGYQFTTDPSCVFDAGNGRYYATELTLDVNPKTGNLTGKNWLDLAVSKTSDPRGGWNIYTIDVTDNGTGGTPKHRDCPCVGDFPHLATDSHGVFLTTNEYPFSSDPGLFGNNFNGAQVYALSKTKTASGAAHVAVVHFEDVRVPSTSGPIRPGFTLWPAQAAGTGYARENNGTIYFVSSFAAEEARPSDFTGHANQVGSWWIANTASLDTTPHLSLEEKTLSTGDYGIPPLANQKSGPVPLRDCVATQCEPGLGGPYLAEQEGGLDSSDTRPLTAVYVNGTVLSALDTAMQVSGNVQSGFEWFAIHAAGPGSTMSNHGYVGVDRGNAIFPSIATDGSGNGYVGFTLSGDSWYPSAGYTTWSSRPGSTLHVAGAGAAPQDGFCEYLAFNCAGTDPPGIRPRWGDYGYAAWDGSRFYLANEYIAHRCTFSTFRKTTPAVRRGRSTATSRPTSSSCPDQQMSRVSSVVPAGLRRRVKLRAHQGSTYTCPFCHYGARDLRPHGHDFAVLRERQVVGGGVRPSACYSCNSSDRERLVFFYLKDELGFFDEPQTKRVLHIAPEKRLSRMMLGLGFGDYVCGDLFTEGYRHPAHVRNIDVMDIPYDDDTFDLVLCNHVLEHIETDDVAIRELARVLKPGGTAILQVPISASSAETFEDFSVVGPREREQTFGQFDHVRIYGQDYVDRLRKGGFTVERVNVSEKYARYGVNPDEELFVCSK